MFLFPIRDEEPVGSGGADVGHHERPPVEFICCRWNLSADGILHAGGNLSAGGSTMGCIFGLRPRIASGTNRCRGAADISRGCCRCNLFSARVGELFYAGDCIWDPGSEAT